MISIVIPLYNKEGQIADTLRSVFAQTYTDYEVVIINDGSTDSSVAAVERISDPRVRLIHQQNAGVSAARNRGIAEARGEYIALLDADDKWKPDYLATIARLIDKYPECDVFATNYEFHNNKGKVTPTTIKKLPFDTTDGILTNYFEVASCSHPPLWTSAVAARKSALESVGGFPIGIKSGEDLLTWARLACRYKIAYCREALAVFQDSSDDRMSKPTLRLGGERFVADELIKLYDSEQSIEKKKFFKAYITRWLKSWCIILIEAEKNHYAINIAFEGLKWGGKLKHFIPIIVLTLLPAKASKKIFYSLRK